MSNKPKKAKKEERERERERGREAEGERERARERERERERGGGATLTLGDGWLDMPHHPPRTQPSLYPIPCQGQSSLQPLQLFRQIATKGRS